MPSRLKLVGNILWVSTMRPALVLLALAICVGAAPLATAEPDCRPFCLPDDLPLPGGDSPEGPEPTSCRPYCIPNP